MGSFVILGRDAQTTRLWNSRILSNGRSGTLLSAAFYPLPGISDALVILTTELPYNKDIIVLILQTR